MNNAIYNFREPKNEPVLTYAPGYSEREQLIKELESQYGKVVDIPRIYPPFIVGTRKKSP
jgi:hypothetical protein